MAKTDSRGPVDAVRPKASVLLLPNFDKPPVVQFKRRGRLPRLITKLSDYSWEKRLRELDKEAEQKAIREIEINQNIVADYTEQLKLSTFQLAHKERQQLRRLIEIHTEWIEKSKVVIGRAD